MDSPQHVTYLFGSPIAHSWSPLLHNTMYQHEGLPWTYSLFESLDMTAFLSLLADPQCMGASVTMPHKIAIVPLLDELTTEGREVGACNTVFIRHDADGRRRYVGTNTDVVGIREALAQNAPGIYGAAAGRPGLVIGGGGAARSAVYALTKWMRCSAVYVVNRDAREVHALIDSCKRAGFGDNVVHVQTPEQARDLPGPAVAVGCVPDLAPVTVEEKTAVEIVEIMLAEKQDTGVILEMAYHPTIWTRLADLAKRSGWQVVLGTEAVIWQGIEQHRLWTGRSIDEIPVQPCKDVFAAALAETASQGSRSRL